LSVRQQQEIDMLIREVNELRQAPAETSTGFGVRSLHTFQLPPIFGVTGNGEQLKIRRHSRSKITGARLGTAVRPRYLQAHHQLCFA
jgi:hypothetical protein